MSSTSPVASIREQARTVRERTGVFESAQLGRIAIRGADRLTWLQGMVSNDTRRLSANAPRLRACVLNATGHLLTDLTLVVVPGCLGLAGFDTDWILAELPIQNVAKIATVLDRFIITEDVEISDVTHLVGRFSIQGPQSPAPDDLLSAIDAVATGVLVLAADHYGFGGADVYFPDVSRGEITAAIAELGIPSIGAGAAELLRIEAGVPLYGVDMDESTIPLEANLGATHISLTKGCYVGQEIIARIDSRGHTNRALTGLVVHAGPAPERGDIIYAPDDGRETGRITSVSTDSELFDGLPIALGYVRHEHRSPGANVRIETAHGPSQATVSEPSFARIA